LGDNFKFQISNFIFTKRLLRLFAMTFINQPATEHEYTDIHLISNSVAGVRKYNHLATDSDFRMAEAALL
jgi:hypothetical protein